MLYQQWAIFSVARFRLRINVNFAKSTRRILCMLSGLAKKLKMSGDHSTACTNRALSDHWISVTYLIGFCKFMMIIKRRFSLYRPGFYGTGGLGMLSILAELRIPLQLFSLWQVVCYKISWQLRMWIQWLLGLLSLISAPTRSGSVQS